MQTVQRFFSWWSSKFKKQSIIGKIILGCSSLFVLCCLCSIPIAILSPSTPTPEVTRTSVVEIPTRQAGETSDPTETLIAAIIQTETSIPTIAPTNMLEPTSTKVTGSLPGLMPADVKINLEQRGFTCGSVEQGQNVYIWSCKQETALYTLRVDIYSRTLFTVDLIDSGAIQYGTPDIELAKSFLGFMATMPYDRAVQKEARTWVENTIPTLKGQGDVREKVFAGVNYRLFGIPTAFTLEMGDLP